MQLRKGFVALAAASALLAGAASAQGAGLVPVAPSGEWGSSPMQVASPPYDGRLFVIERSGAIRLVKDGVLQPTPYLTVPGINTAGERGLLSIAFAPDFDTSGRFYVYANFGPGEGMITLQVVEYRAAPGADVADPATARTVFSQPMGGGTHNGGQINFGPDGYLYATVGDNGDAGNSQDPGTILGKVLRFNPALSSPGTWSVPADNPIAGSPVWALGLRNPFRSSFDPLGRLIIADVGGGSFEEINVGARGANYGWPDCEGPCANPAFTNPFYAYAHSGGGNAVIGGAVVVDASIGELLGRYVYGDINAPDLRGLNLVAPGGDPYPAGVSIDNSYSLTSVGNDSRGCTYVTADDTVYRLAPNTGSPAACPRPVPTPPAAGGAAAQVLGRNLRIDRRGRLKVRVSCTGDTACAGTLRISSKRKLRIRRGAMARTLLIARGPYSAIEPGRSRTVTLKVRRAGLKLIKQRRKLRSTAGAGGATRTVTVLAPRRR